jgi:hypothetical protein
MGDAMQATKDDFGAFKDTRLLMGGSDFQIENGPERIVFQGKLEINRNPASRNTLCELISVLTSIRDAIPEPAQVVVGPSKKKLLMTAFRRAMASEDGLGSKADLYTLIHIDQLTGPEGAGVAYNLEDKAMFVMVGEATNSHKLETMDAFLLDVSQALSDFFRTLVIPAEGASPPGAFWGDSQHGHFVAYQFALADSPRSLRY